jgi:hypothetical protein
MKEEMMWTDYLRRAKRRSLFAIRERELLAAPSELTRRAGVRRCAVPEIGHARAAFALRSFSTCLHKRTRRKLSLASGGSTMNLFYPQIAAALAATISLAACIAPPAAPTIPVAPGPSKTLEMFAADQAACQQNAAAQLSPAVAAATVEEEWRHTGPERVAGRR